MIINSYSEFEKAIRGKSLSGGVIVCGQERQLIDKTVEKIYSLIDMLPDMNITRLSGEGLSQDDVLNACETFPVMANKRLVHIKNADFLVKDEKKEGEEKSLGAFMTDYLTKVPDYTILLMTAFGDINEKSKAVAGVKAAGMYVRYFAFKRDELNKWIEGEFSAQGKTITKSDIYYLTSLAGTSTDQLEMEIEKLVCYCKDESMITREHIEAVVHRDIEDNIFKMVDSITRRDADTALSILDALLTEKEKPLIILSMINRQFRQLLMVKGCMEENLSGDEIKSRLKLRMKDFAFKNLLSQARNSQEDTLRRALNRCLDTDYSMKNGMYGSDEYDMALEMLIIELCK
jgi:DNA polymerase-3 subunit delta